MNVRVVLLAMTLPVFAAAGRAELQFPSHRLTLPAEPGQDLLHGDFHFRNAGKEAITIVNLTTSCGCTTATLEHKTYAPGEAGVISATFSVGERNGHQSKEIMVQTDEAKDNVYQLTLETDIPVVVSLEPRLLVWKLGAATNPQSVKVTYAAGKSYQLASAVESEGRFLAEIVTTPGRVEPEIRIRPVRTDEAVLGVMLLQFVGTDGAKLQRSVLMRVVNLP